MALKSMPNSYKIVLWVLHFNDIIEQQNHGTLINILVLNIYVPYSHIMKKIS